MLGSPSLVSRVRSLNYAVACEGDGGNCDGGTDGGRDGGPDSGHDGGSDAGRDGGTDGGRDGGRDGGPDGGQDGGPDGGRDGGCDPAAMQAAALRGEAVDPGACKWNIPPDTRNVLPINKIYDVGPANLIVKSQESQITDYEICSVDNKKTSSGSIQGCWRYAVNLMGACVAPDTLTAPMGSAASRAARCTRTTSRAVEGAPTSMDSRVWTPVFAPQGSCAPVNAT